MLVPEQGESRHHFQLFKVTIMYNRLPSLTAGTYDEYSSFSLLGSCWWRDIVAEAPVKSANKSIDSLERGCLDAELFSFSER